MKLIVENDFERHQADIVSHMTKNSPRTIKLHGVFMQAETENSNQRRYHLYELESETEKFRKEKIDTNSALSELEHPDSIIISPDRACARILALEQDGKNFIGDAVVLASDDRFGIKGTVQGDVLAGLLNYGTAVGFSSRGVGDITEDGWVENYNLITIDCVLSPSIGIMSSTNANRFVNGILESKEFVINSHGDILENRYNAFENKLKKLPRRQSLKNEKIISAVSAFLESISKC